MLPGPFPWHVLGAVLLEEFDIFWRHTELKLLCRSVKVKDRKPRAVDLAQSSAG